MNTNIDMFDLQKFIFKNRYKKSFLERLSIFIRKKLF